MKRFVYVLTGFMNVIGIIMLSAIILVALAEWPRTVFSRLSDLTTTAFWVFFGYWCIALLLNAQSKVDKKYKEERELVELWGKQK